MGEPNKVRVAIAGVGNCASSLVQGVQYYKDADENATVPCMHKIEKRQIIRTSE